MSANAKLPPPPPAPANGVITAASGNRKKQKRRAKQAAQKAATQLEMPPPPADDQPADVGYDEDALGYQDEEDDYSDAEPDNYDDHYPNHATSNGLHSPPPVSAGKKKNKKKKAAAVLDPHHHGAYDPHMSAARRSHLHMPMPGGHESIWNTSSQQERQNIKEYWLSLSEDERKNLLKIEKDTVLKKMKQQQKHSCSCSVCGRKRTAIEEELEVLYEGYYEELEQYAHHDQPLLPTADGLMPDPLHHRPHPLSTPPPNLPPPHHRTSRIREDLDEEDEYSDEEEEEEEEEEYSDEEDYSDEEPEPVPEQFRTPAAPPGVPDFLNFGSHLTVKDNLLTVADDLLKNDGRKFIEMMEQLAERRMQRENRSQYEPEPHSAYPPGDPAYDHEDPMAAGDEYDDDEASYDSQEEYDDDMDEEDEMGGLTEEQRMQEGRRMFQIFAARMFEQRVLTAYREKVARERQQKLLEELDNEKSREAQREAKKQRDAAKKKEKKKQQQQAKAEEKAKRDAEKAEEEARLREAEEKKQEEQRRKKEEQRRKREEEKKRQDEEKARKEQEKLRRHQEELQRREETERKAKEAKAAEKAKKEEQRKREREEREAREKEARDRKAQEEKEKKEREAKARADKEAKEREKTAQQAAHPPNHPPQISKRPSQAGMVAIPGVYPKQTTSGINSPHPQIATPAIPKAPTPARQRQASQQGSHASSPKQAHSQLSSAPSKSSSPGSAGPQQALNQPKTILQKANNQQTGGQQNHQPVSTASPLHQQPVQPPPGMPLPYQPPGGFGGMSSLGFQGFQGPQGGHMPNLGPRGPMQMYPHQAPPAMGMQNRPPFLGMNGMLPPPGMMPPHGRGFPFDMQGGQLPPPGFAPQQPPYSNHTSPPGHSPVGAGSEQQRQPGHSRQQSADDRERFESTTNQPIARPAPIQRPGSVRPHGQEADVDDLSKHLGSSALLDDADDPLPPNAADARRHSSIPANPRNSIPGGPLGPLGNFGTQPIPFGTPGSTFGTPFGQSPGLGQSWGSLPNTGMGSWMHNNSAFATNGFQPMGAPPMRGPSAPLSRPLTIRLAICQACKQLSSRGDSDGYHDVDVLLQQIQANRAIPPDAPPPSLKEIEEICETEGDGQNGGGELQVRKSENDSKFAVKWEADAGTPDQARGHSGLSVIGSPVPSKSSPAGGAFGAPGMRRPDQFQSLGAVGSQD